MIESEDLSILQKAVDSLLRQAMSLKAELDLIKLSQELGRGQNDVQILDEDEDLLQDEEDPDEQLFK